MSCPYGITTIFILGRPTVISLRGTSHRITKLSQMFSVVTAKPFSTLVSEVERPAEGRDERQLRRNVRRLDAPMVQGTFGNGR